MRGGANAELPRFAPVVEAARGGQLAEWAGVPRGRLSLILVLDQFPRGLFPGSPDAYASDTQALQLTEEGSRAGQYDALTSPWEKFFFVLPLAHAEGPDHLRRMKLALALGEKLAAEAPPHLQPIYQFSLSQANGHLEVITRFGRFPHRNPILGRASTPEELHYLEKGDFVYNRDLPERSSP
ncbi:MAG: hypothetical protein K0R61_1505 [Microvirga sp.]|nr:hypothetical protein [Microvirga sp.]